MKTKYFTLLLLLLLSPARAEQSNEDLLEADQAFQLSTRTVNGTTLEARWKIAPDYYLYRDKFKFEAIEGGTLKDPVFPRGKKKQDPLFGTVETYTKSVKVRLPIERQGSAPSLRLRITAQGCNEPVGVCYPPIVKEVDFKLPPVKASGTPVVAVAATPVGEVQSLKDLTQSTSFGSGAAEPVDPEIAFRVNITARGGEALLARIDIAECCYLYGDKMKFELTAADGSALPADVRLGSVELPAGKIKTDEFIGKTEIYETGFEVALPIAGGASPDRDMLLHVTYQGCSEKGVIICYPPVTKKFGVQFRAGALSVAAGPETAAASPVVPPTRDTGKLMVAMLAAFGAGLLLSFTPCVLPMVPILSGVIVGTEGTHITKLRGGLLSYSYVLGTSLTYAVAGAVAGATGEQLQAYFQTPWAIGTFAALLVLLALSMFGFYQLQVPSSIQSLLLPPPHASSSQTMARRADQGVHSWPDLGAHHRRPVSPVLSQCSARPRCQGPGARRRHHVLAGARSGGDPDRAGCRRRLPAAQGRQMDGQREAPVRRPADRRRDLPARIPAAGAGAVPVGGAAHRLRRLPRRHPEPAGKRGRLALFVERDWHRSAHLGRARPARRFRRPPRYPQSAAAVSVVSGAMPAAGSAGPVTQKRLFDRVGSLSDLENRLAAARPRAAGDTPTADWC
jgi:thiol:disulfide interchange protein